MSDLVMNSGKPRRRLAPSEEYEIFVSVLTGQATQREAAAKWKVDRSTVTHICRTAKQGGAGRAGRRGAGSAGDDRAAGRAGRRPGRGRAAGRHGHRAGGRLASARGKSALGLTAGPVPARVDATVKAGLLDLVEHTVAGGGWPVRRACALLRLDHARCWHWVTRSGAGRLDDAPPGGRPLHGLLDWERAAIIGLYEAWGEAGRCHRKLAHRGSRLGLVHVSESTVARLLVAEGLRLEGPPPREPRPRTPWPEWLEWKPSRVRGWDFTRWGRARRCSIAILDIVSRKWVATLTSAEETSTQVEACFTAALEAEGLLDAADELATAALREAITSGDRDAVHDLAGEGQVPLLLAISDNGPQMRSVTTREFMAGVAIAWQFGRPHTPQDQAWIETLSGHVKGEWPYLEKIRDPGEPDAELDRVRAEYNTARLHAAIGCVTPDDEHQGRGEAIRQARRTGLTAARPARIAYRRNQQQENQ
jgi:putative transposase